jgi:hypothetical protein
MRRQEYIELTRLPSWMSSENENESESEVEGEDQGEGEEEGEGGEMTMSFDVCL